MSTRGFKSVYPTGEPFGFDGGKNSKYQRALIPDNESPDCLNVDFSDGGAGTREGFTRLNTAAVGSFVCDGLYTRNDSSGAETMVGWWNGTMYDLQTTSFVTVPSAQSVYTAGQRVCATQYQNYMFFGNGASTPYKWDGTDFTRHGVVAVSGTVSAVSDVASQGTLTGSYSYRFTYVNSAAVEGDVGSTKNITLASGIARLSDIPTGAQSFGVAARRIYRTVAGGSTYYRVAELSDNSTTTYDDNNDDAALGAAAPTDNGVPPNYEFCVYHKDRLWCNDPDNPNYIWYSDLGEPFTFQSTNFILIGDATTDIPRSLAVYEDSICIFADHSDFLIYMPDTDPTSWTKLKVASSYGSKSPFAPIQYNGKILFPAMQADKVVGFAALEGAQITPSATLLNVSAAGSFLQSDRIEDDIFDIQETYVKNISGIVYKNKAYVAVTHEAGSTTNNRVYLFDFSISNLKKKQEASWCPWTGINAAQFTIYDGDLYFAESTDTGFANKLLDGTYNDNGAAIDSYYWTKEFYGENKDKDRHKDWRWLDLLVENLGDWNMNVTRRVDSDEGSDSLKRINLKPDSGGIWDADAWDETIWGRDNQQKQVKIYAGTAAGKRIQYKFDNQNTADQAFKVLRASLGYNKKGMR